MLAEFIASDTLTLWVIDCLQNRLWKDQQPVLPPYAGYGSLK